jgi:hypothetical protein
MRDLGKILVSVGGLIALLYASALIANLLPRVDWFPHLQYLGVWIGGGVLMVATGGCIALLGFVLMHRSRKSINSGSDVGH